MHVSSLNDASASLYGPVAFWVVSLAGFGVWVVDDGVMARSYRGVDRDQPFLLPVDMRDWLPEDHVVWFLIDAVGLMDTTMFHSRACLGGVGRRGFDPDMLLTLFVYGMAQGVSSSRKIESLCHTDVAFRVICGQDVPDHTVLARFRQTHEEALTDLLEESLVLAGKVGMIRLGVVALDGTKIAANASRLATRSEESLRRYAQEYLTGLGQADTREDGLFGHGRGDELPDKLLDRSHRGSRIQKALDQVRGEREKREADQADRQARRQARQDRQAGSESQEVVRSRAKVERAQARFDSRQARQESKYEAYHHKACSGGGKPNGRPPSRPEDSVALTRAKQDLEQAKGAYQAALEDQSERRRVQAAYEEEREQARKDKESQWGRKPRANVTDPDSRLLATLHGWCQGMNCQLSISQDELIMSARPTQDHSDVRQFQPTVEATSLMLEKVGERIGRDLKIGLVLADAGYDSAANLAAPGPDRLIPHAKGFRVQAAALDEPTVGPPPPGASQREVLDHRLRTREGATAYKQRAPMIESANAWIKDRRGLRRFTRRGLKAVAAELALACATTNILKIYSKGIVLQPA